MNDLIDTTEMYLRTIFELEEEGVAPLRARIAERLEQSGPTVSQTVARMERDDLVVVGGDRHLQLTEHGRELATAVMRKHRLAELLLVRVIGLEWPQVHNEACRWEHVMSEAVEHKLVALLDHPTTSPYGNPIPGMDRLDPAAARAGTGPAVSELVRLDDYARSGGGTATIKRIAEHVQMDEDLMTRLRTVQLVPERAVDVDKASASDTSMTVRGNGESIHVAASILHAVLATAQ